MSQEEALFVGCFLQVWYIIASFLTVGLPHHAPMATETTELIPTSGI